MFNVRPDKLWFGFCGEPPEDLPGFRLNTDGSVLGALPSDSSTAFLGYDLGAGEAVPGSTMFNVRPEQEFPGLHNFKPPEEMVPGFRMNADGSIRNDATPAIRPSPDVGGKPFGVLDLQSLDHSAFMPVGGRSPSPYLAYGDGAYRSPSGAPLPHPEPIQSAGSPPLAPMSDPFPSSAPSFTGTTTNRLPLGAQPSLLDRPASDVSRPPLASFSFTAGTLPASGQHSPLSFAGPISGRGLSTWPRLTQA